MNQEEDGQHYLYSGVLHSVGTDIFVEMNALKFLHKYWATRNILLLSRFRRQSNEDLRSRSRAHLSIQLFTQNLAGVPVLIEDFRSPKLRIFVVRNTGHVKDTLVREDDPS